VTAATAKHGLPTPSHPLGNGDILIDGALGVVRARRHAGMDSKARKPRTGGSTMTAQPAGRIRASGPDTGPCEVIRLGGQDAVVLMLVYLTRRPRRTRGHHPVNWIG
jgi:hypothetical protein